MSPRLPNIFCRWRNISPETVCELVSQLPQEVMTKERFRQIMSKSKKYPSFFTNVSQAPRQWGLYYISDGMYYPRFKRNLTLQEAENYVRIWLRRYIIPNPTSRLSQLQGSINLVKAIVSFMENNPDETDFQSIMDGVCGETVLVNDILLNTLNNYSGVLEIEKVSTDVFSARLVKNYKEIMIDNYDHVLNEEEYFHHFDGILKNVDVFSYGEQVKLLLSKKNLVLTGAPGTGKTYAARQMAAYIVSGGTKDFDSLSDDEKKRIGFTQFHPSYDYTDFVEGLRPDKDGDFKRRNGVFKQFCEDALGYAASFDVVYNLLVDKIASREITKYELRKGGSNDLSIKDGNIYYHSGASSPRPESRSNMEILYNDFVKDGIFDLSSENGDSLDGRISKLTNGATKNLDSSEYLWTLNWLLTNSKSIGMPCVFIIDEINRGELSKIFGELFYSIEPEYRGAKYPVKTQYHNMIEEGDTFKGGFFIPNNVYILGTMNDVDRGVEAMDFAIRRRFAWHEVTADESASRMGVKGDALAKMNAINDIIKKDLGRAYCIGGSYFRKFDKEGAESTWENHLYGILYEYYRGEPRVDDKVEDIRLAFFAAKEEKETDQSTEQPEVN